MTTGKPRGGRPKQDPPSVVVRLALTLRPGEDDDLLSFFQRVPAGLRPAAVKQALRNGAAAVDGGSACREDLLADALDDLLL